MNVLVKVQDANDNNRKKQKTRRETAMRVAAASRLRPDLFRIDALRLFSALCIDERTAVRKQNPPLPPDDAILLHPPPLRKEFFFYPFHIKRLISKELIASV